jgi:hypothetical protein
MNPRAKAQTAGEQNPASHLTTAATKRIRSGRLCVSSREVVRITQIWMICVWLGGVTGAGWCMCLLAAGGRGGWWLPGYWVPAAEVLYGLAVFPFDGVLSRWARCPPVVTPAMSATPRRVPTETTNPLSWKVNASSGRPFRSRPGCGRPSRPPPAPPVPAGQHVPGARVGHRGEVAGDVDIRVRHHDRDG